MTGDVAASESVALEGSDFNNTFTVNTSNNVTIRTNGGSDVVNVNTDNAAAAEYYASDGRVRRRADCILLLGVSAGLSSGMEDGCRGDMYQARSIALCQVWTQWAL